MKAEFADKEKAYKKEIDELKQKINESKVEAKQHGNELSFAFAMSQNEYPYLEDAQRVEVIKKDAQLKLLKERIQ